MIKILDHSKSLSQLVNDTTNGLGNLDALECFVTEELNGIYEAQVVILQTDKHFNDVALNGLLEINAGEVIGKQIFRIYFISKPIDGKILIKCQHISYDLAKIAVEPFTSTGAVSTKNNLLSHIVGTYPFDMMTDIVNSTSVFTLDIPKSFRECLGGWEGSVLDTFRCEYEWDNLLVKMLAHRGTDEGVRIAYGKNLTDFKQDENIQNVFTSVLGYAVVNEQTYVGEVYHKIVSNMPRVKIVDFSSDFGDTTPTTAQLTQKAQDYATRNAIEVPDVSIDIKFVPLYQTEEYKNIAPLERVGLGDTVHVFFEKLNVEASARVVKTVWNALLEKYESVELGDTRANLTTILDDAVQEAKENITIDAGFIESEMNEMSQLIINGLGLHRTLVPLATGGHRMYLHNKPSLAESDTQYVITASGFMISTDYGQTWTSGWDAQGNVVTNALSTITLKALEIYGSVITFGDPDSLYITAQPYSVGGQAVGITFDGSGYIRMRPTEQFDIFNQDENNNTYNDLMMRKNGSKNQTLFQLRNFDKEKNTTANFIEMDARYYDSDPTATYNRMLINNRHTFGSTAYGGNGIQMYSYPDRNYYYTRNYIPGSNSYANVLQMVYGTSSSYIALQNWERDSSSTRANDITMRSNDSPAENYIYIRNYKKGNTSSMANTIEMCGVPLLQNSENYIEINNYDIDGDNVGNSFIMSKSRNINRIRLVGKRGGEDVAYISILKNASNEFRIILGIYGTTISGTEYKPCSIYLNSSDGTIKCSGSGFYWNGVQKW